MRLMFPRALTVAAAVVGGAGAMAFPKLVLRDAIPSQNQGPAFAAPVPASVPVIRIPPGPTTLPQRHVATRPPAPKQLAAVTAKPVAARTQLPNRPRASVAAPARPASAGTPATAPEPRSAPAQKSVPAPAAPTPAAEPATAALHAAPPAPAVEHIDRPRPSEHAADDSDTAKKPKKPKPKKAKKPKNEEQHEQAVAPPQPEVPAAATDVDDHAQEQPPLPAPEPGEDPGQQGKSNGSSEGNRGRGQQGGRPGNG